jgi:hypothetical protein
MDTEDILRSLSPEIDWIVLFRLACIRALLREEDVKRMFRLADSIDIADATHVVLSSDHRYIAMRSQMHRADGGPNCNFASFSSANLFLQRRELFDSVDINEADCLAYARTSAAAPVLLHMRVADGDGLCHVTCHHAPSLKHYELLAAVGIEYLGYSPAKSGFGLRFRNRLPSHFNAAALANFSRPGNCNRFFLNHCEIDATVESGLTLALRTRIEKCREQGRHALRRLMEQSLRADLSMGCEPPPPKAKFPFGNIVPLGFLLHAVGNESPGGLDRVGVALQDKLLSARQGPHWAFHRGHLVTCTDSALVLKAFADPEAIEALEDFADGSGGYFPQLWAHKSEAGRMRYRDATAHWCQSDFGTTCLVRGLRAQAGLLRHTSLEYLLARFDTRAALYFANPYMVDWALAVSLRADADIDSAGIRHRLTDELLGGINRDYSFGAYDRALSTSLAILALAELGYRGRTLCLSQSRLADMVDVDTGTWPVCTVFYSSRRGSKRDCAEFETTFYVDEHKVITTSLAMLALSEPADAASVEKTVDERIAHPRYRAAHPAEYVRDFAIPAYVV